MVIQRLFRKKLHLLASFALTLGVVALCQLAPSRAQAATITVGGSCTLDGAVASVNAGSNQSSCSGTGTYGTSDTIMLPAGTFTYTDAASITKSVTIQGAGRSQSIVDAGGNNAGLTFINNNTTPKLATVQDLSIINANTAGRAYIYVSDFSLSVNNVEIYSTNNSYTTQGIIQADAHSINGLTRTVNNVYVHDVSGDSVISLYVLNGTTSTDNVVQNTTIKNVSVVFGGAIIFGTYDGGGTFTGSAYNNTIQDFTASSGGGALFATTQPNGAGNAAVNATFRNNTIRFTAPSSTTPAVIGVAIAAPSTVAATNIFLQNNLLVQGNCAQFLAGAGGTENTTITSLGGNVTTEPTCPPFLNQSSDHSVAFGTLNAKLSPLQNNGGTNPTIALLADSEAIDAGVVNGLSTDQRGIARPQGGGFDAGAYEYAPPPASVDAGPASTSTADSKGSLAATGQPTYGLAIVAALVTSLGAILAIRSRTPVRYKS